MDFLQSLPPESKSKVLLTSRQRTGGWELPISVPELDLDETTEFVRVKCEEMSVDFPLDAGTCRQLLEVTGGLPLAVQWTIARYKREGRLDTVLEAVRSKDSPVLEFSFRNIWQSLSADAQATLGVLTIFDGPPTIQQLSIATEWRPERIERSIVELGDVTLVARTTLPADGRVICSALPITIQFARHQLAALGDFEVTCRRRVRRFEEQMELHQTEVRRFVTDFERYGLETDNEKRAAILCKRAQSEVFIGNADSADFLFKQARELVPNSAYVLAMSASYELARNRVGLALGFAKQACQLATRKTGALCYAVLARIHWAQHDKSSRVAALERAVGFDRTNIVNRHQYGVALSWSGETERAIEVFSGIIEEERGRAPARESLLMALKTRIINLRRVGRSAEAADDLEYAKRILAENPHLSDRASHIMELVEASSAGS